MKKLLCALLAALTLLAAVVPAMAVDESQSYLFELSIDGSDTKQAAPRRYRHGGAGPEAYRHGRGLHHVRHAGRVVLRP